MTTKAILFDMDGLMFDTERLSDTCWRYVAPQFGLHFEPNELSFFRGLNTNDCRTAALKRFGDDFPYDAFRAEAKKEMRARLEQHVPIKDGLLELLAYGKANDIPMAVVSSTSKESVSRLLELTDITDYFKTLVCGDMVEHSKPQPDIFLLGAKTLGVAPEDCMVLEDSFNGVRAGHAAGCYTVMVPDCDAPTEEIASLTNAIVPDLHAVRAMLEAQA